METSKERRKRLDHERYMRQREERLRKAHDRYWSDADKYRKYRRLLYKNRVLNRIDD